MLTVRVRFQFFLAYYSCKSKTDENLRSPLEKRKPKPKQNADKKNRKRDNRGRRRRRRCGAKREKARKLERNNNSIDRHNKSEHREK
jgi:hypothetical protein